MARESFSKNFIHEANGKVFLLSKASNIRIIAMHGKCIKLGQKIMVEKGDTIITIFKSFDKVLVSVSTYDGTLKEYFSEVLPYEEQDTDADIIRKVYSDIQAPNIYEA